VLSKQAPPHKKIITEKSQKQQILDYLLEGNEITPMDALNKFGCFRLGARIADLKKDGYDIKTRIAKGDKNYAIYTMEVCDE
jgi:hypothetical protein